MGEVTHLPYGRIPTNICRFTLLQDVKLNPNFQPLEEAGPVDSLPRNSIWKWKKITTVEKPGKNYFNLRFLNLHTVDIFGQIPGYLHINLIYIHFF